MEMVSNPHRYGQKAPGVGVPGAGEVGFQTLIGTVKRLLWRPGGRSTGGFQTLIGTVKSFGFIRENVYWWLRFQTLIGTVKRRGGWAGAIRSYRFQTLIGTVKRGGDGLQGLRFLSFQTLIGTVKSPSAHIPALFLEVFQTLIGTVKRPRRNPCLMASGPVSNPHRYGQKGRPWGWWRPGSSCFKPS